MECKYAETVVTVNTADGVLSFTPLPGGLAREGKRVLQPITMWEYRIGVEGTVNVKGILGDVRVTGDMTMATRGFLADMWVGKDPAIQFFRESGAQVIYTPGSNRWASIMTVTRAAAHIYGETCPDWKDRILCVTLTHKIREVYESLDSLGREMDRMHQMLDVLNDRRTFI
jgi:hypothetical protein